MRQDPVYTTKSRPTISLNSPEILAAARKTAGPILELAAGSGRITRALLALGRPLTAVDSSVEMLAILKGKAEDRTFNPRSVPVELVEADMSGFDVGGEFGCVVLGASSITLLDPRGRRELFRSGGGFIGT